MSQIREIESAWKTQIDAVAAKASTVTSGTADSGTTKTLVDSALSGTNWQFAVVSMTGGNNSGRWRVVTSWNDTTDTCTFREGFPAAIAANDTYTITFAPLADCRVFQRPPHGGDIRKSELPAVIASASRRRNIEQMGIGMSQGSKYGHCTLETLCLSKWSDDAASEVVSDKLAEQIDQMRLSQKELGSGIARFEVPEGQDEISAFDDIGEKNASLRVYASLLRVGFAYPM